MDVFKAIKSRRSVRAYQDKDIPDETLAQILEAARLVPSARNLQGYKFVVIKDKEKIKQIAEINKMPFVVQAPVVLLCVSTGLENKYHLIDLAIAVDHITLAAWGLGVGSCWIGGIGASEELAKVIDAPNDTMPAIILSLGFPADREIPKRRKSIEEIVSYEKY